MAQNSTAMTFGLFLETVSGMPSFPTFCAYLLMVMLSPLWRMCTKPFEMRPIITVYNFFCTSLSTCTCLGFIYFGMIKSPQIYSREKVEYLQEVYKLYYWTKSIELTDTVIMILRHKTRQISFLHVFHHSTMLVLSNFASLYTPWPKMSFFLAMNSFVHICLYLYYALSSLNPGNPPPWKKQMTQLQLIQFVLGLAYSTYGYFYHRFCVYSIIYALLMIWFFGNFYYHAYIKRKAVKESKNMNGKSE